MTELDRDDDDDNAVTTSLAPDTAPLKRRRVMGDATLVVGIGQTKEDVELAAEKPNRKTSLEDGSDKTMVQGAVCSSMVDTRDHHPCDQSHASGDGKSAFSSDDFSASLHEIPIEIQLWLESEACRDDAGIGGDMNSILCRGCRRFLSQRLHFDDDKRTCRKCLERQKQKRKKASMAKHNA